MELFLNEWSALSLSDENTLPESLNFFGFWELLTLLKGKGVKKIYVPRDIRQRFLSYCLHSDNGDLQMLCYSFKSLLGDWTEGFAYAMQTADHPSLYSVFAGMSWSKDQPLVSLCLSANDSGDAVKGNIFRLAENGTWILYKQHQSVGNLYKDNLSAFQPFWEAYEFRECRQKNPEVEPVWNLEKTGNIMNSYGFPLATLSPGELMPLLEKAGTAIAECNGWVYDERVTKKNNSSRKHRVIFKSGHFKRKNSYLSIDFEHPDGCFELLDKYGCHLGERFFRDGSNTGAEISSSHNIEV